MKSSTFVSGNAYSTAGQQRVGGRDDVLASLLRVSFWTRPPLDIRNGIVFGTLQTLNMASYANCNEASTVGCCLFLYSEGGRGRGIPAASHSEDKDLRSQSPTFSPPPPALHTNSKADVQTYIHRSTHTKQASILNVLDC